MERIQKQSNQEPRGKVYLGKGVKETVSIALAKRNTARPISQF